MTRYADLKPLSDAQVRLVGAERALARAAAATPADPVALAAATAEAEAARLAKSETAQRLEPVLAATIAGLDPRVPLLMLPVRLETRYDLSGGRVQLKVRVYPDDIHIDAHEPGLTAAERAAGVVYWEEIGKAPAPGAATDRLRAWTTLVAKLGPERAAWTARALNPSNPIAAADRKGIWTRAAVAGLLPDCWRAEAWRGDTLVASATGGLIARPLQFGPNPVRETEQDDGMRWMSEFDYALAAGMGLVLPLPDAQAIDLLLVFGVRGTEAPGAEADTLRDFLVAHRYGVGGGFDLIAPGTPTNNTVATPSAHGAPDPTGTGRFVDPLAAEPALGDDALLLADAFGLAATTFAGAPGAGNRSIARETDMATLLWPATWGYYFTQMLRLPEWGDAGRADWRRWILENVRGCGPLPAIRAGRQPYGVLPVTSLDRWRLPPGRGFASVELLLSRGGDPPATQVRLFGGLDDQGGWTLRADQPSALPTPADATVLATTSAEIDGAGAPLLVVAHAGSADPITAGVTIALARIDDPDLALLASFAPTPGRRGFPRRQVRGIAVATGALAPSALSRPAPDLLLVLQFEPATRPGPGQTLLLLGNDLSASGTGRWSEPVDITRELASGDRVVSAAIIANGNGGQDLLLVSENDKASGATPMASLRRAIDLAPDGTPQAWSPPAEVGTMPGGSASAGSALAVADVFGTGVPGGLLAQFSPLSDGTVAASYQVAEQDPNRDLAWRPQQLNLGGGDFVPQGLTLASAGVVFLPRIAIAKSTVGFFDANSQVNLLRRLRGDWRAAADRAARHRPGFTASDRTLLDILASDAVSSSCERRPFVGARALEANWRLLNEAIGPPPGRAKTEEQLQLLGTGFEPQFPPILARGAFTELALPLATEPATNDLAGVSLTGDERGSSLGWLRDMRKATPQELHDNWIGSDVSLLARLVRHSLLQAYADAALALVPVPGAAPPPLPEPELVDLPDFMAADPVEHVTLTAWRHLSNAATQVGGVQVAELLWRGGVEKTLPAEAGALQETLDALDHLITTPAGDLARLAAGVLDLASHRLDAWITAVATNRLAELRHDKADGIQVGGYGFVRDLAPRGGPVSTGYIHAPSVIHATTAAVLRSGYLSRDSAQLAVDLSSRRVRTALDVLAAVGEGQSLGAVLGYRLERRLTEDSLAQHLPLLRQYAPLEVAQIRPVPPGTDVASLGGMVTVDGLALIEQFAKPDPWDNPPVGPTTPFPIPDPDDQRKIEKAVTDLADAADAIADIGTAESVHQILQRNPVRAAGTLDALTRGELPVSADPDILRTPRQGTGVTHRVLLVAPDPTEAAAAAAVAEWLPAGQAAEAALPAHWARFAAEPQLGAWAAMILGDPERVRYRVVPRDPATGGPGIDPETELPFVPVLVTLDTAGISPWDVLAGPSPEVANLGETNLGRRLLRAAVGRAGVQGADLLLLAERAPDWPPDALGLPELLAIAETARRLIMAARPATANDLRARDGAEPFVAAELAARVLAARSALAKALDGLGGHFELSDTAWGALAKRYPELAGAKRPKTLLDLPLLYDVGEAASLAKRPELDRVETCGDALELLSAFGIADAAPRPLTGEAENDRAALAIQARAAFLKGKERQALSTERGDKDPGAMEALFGDGFRALPRFTHELSEAPVATGAGRAAVDRWLDGVAAVRDGVVRLQDMLVVTEVAGGNAVDWDVVQLPIGDGAERWAALPANLADTGTIPAGRTSIVAACLVPGWRSRERTAALWIDAWVETVPARTENTAIAFHLDAPDACAPQAALLAVAPVPGQPWTWPILGDVLRETVALSEVRLVDSHLLPLYGHLLPALFLARSVGGIPGGDTVATSYEA